MQALLVLAALAALAVAHPTFSEFKKMYNKVYPSEAIEQLRAHIYADNIAIINKHNNEHHSWTMGVNEFADLSHSEFKSIMVPKKTDFSFRLASAPTEEIEIEGLPASVDWRTHTPAVVTPIKNQGQCGSCWAFSTTGSTEGQHALATGNLVSLSEQNLVDCSDAEGNEGCNGGLMTQAFEYIIKNKGIDTEASYPYTAADGKCVFKAANVGATIATYVSLPTGSLTALANASAYQGPISVAMDAGLNSFQLYKSGIYDPKGCSATQLDHGVLVVGYGTQSNVAYWIVKNSWGTTWGEEGYFLIAQANNECGLATMASFPVV